MTKKIKDLTVIVGSYQSEGKKKNRHLNIGHVLKLDDGREMWCINTTFNPAGVPNPDNRDTIIINVFDTKSDDQAAHKGFDKQGDVASSQKDDQEIPF